MRRIFLEHPVHKKADIWKMFVKNMCYIYSIGNKLLLYEKVLLYIRSIYVYRRPAMHARLGVKYC
jgi:hypothetical protein